MTCKNLLKAAYLLFVAAIGVSVSSCDKAPVAKEAPPADGLVASDVPVLKISPSQQWKYRVTIENPKNPQTGMPASASFERVRRFMGRVDPGNGQPPADCFEVSAKGAKILREYVKITPEEISMLGQAIVGEDGVQTDLVWFTEPITFFKAGLIAGDSLPLTVLNEDKGLWRVVRVIAREKITVPKGEFETVRLQMLGRDGQVTLRRTYWYAPGTGLIREEKVREINGKPVFSETDELTD